MQASDWQPIATAPKDGTRVLLWWPDEPSRYKFGIGWWEELSLRFIGIEQSGQPTHYMPIVGPKEDANATG